MIRLCSPAIFLLMLLASNPARAQSRMLFDLFAGAGAGYIRSSAAGPAYSLRVLPRAGVSVLIPVEGGISIKTGAAYQQTGWHEQGRIDDTDGTSLEIKATIRLHVLAIPLQLSRAFGRGRLRYEIAGGMSYWFFVQADEHLETEEYRGSRLLSGDAIDYHPYIALIPDDSRVKSAYNGTEYYRFNPALRVDASVVWKGRWQLQAFWEHGLNNLSAVAGNTGVMHLSAAGLTAGIRL